MVVTNPDYETVKQLCGKFCSVEVERSEDTVANRLLIEKLLAEGYTVKHTATGFRFQLRPTDKTRVIPL